MSAYETVSKEIGGVRYDVTKLGAKVASRLLLKLMKSVAPVFLVAAAAGKKSLDLSRATGAIKDLSEDDFDWVCERFAEKTDVHIGTTSPSLGSAGLFDLHFSGRYTEMFEWLEFCVEVNFGPFFGVLKDRIAAKAPGLVGATPPPSASTSPTT